MKKFLQTLSLAVPVAMTIMNPGTLINLALGMAVKHGTNIPNNAIPFLNMLGSTGVSYLTHAKNMPWQSALVQSVQEGGMLAGLSTFVHQGVKIPLKSLVHGKIAKRIGPGQQFSL